MRKFRNERRAIGIWTRRIEFAKPAAEGNQFGIGEMLAADNQHKTAIKRIQNGANRLRLQRRRQVQIGEFKPDCSSGKWR